MKNRTAIYTRTTGPDPELLLDLAKIVEDRGDPAVVAIYTDDGSVAGKGRNAGWRRLMANLGEIDEIVIGNVGDLPGTTVKDLLAVLETVRGHGVNLVVGDIDTSTGASAVLDLVAAYRRAKRGQAIKRGQDRGRRLGRHIGRPAIPEIMRRRIAATLAEGGGAIRATARRHNVSPAFVVSVKKSMALGSSLLAA
jgi:DNA invertase Pin-like site-specific DNA recombinase